MKIEVYYQKPPREWLSVVWGELLFFIYPEWPGEWGDRFISVLNSDRQYMAVDNDPKSPQYWDHCEEVVNILLKNHQDTELVQELLHLVLLQKKPRKGE